jgi:hypothetical protein
MCTEIGYLFFYFLLLLNLALAQRKRKGEWKQQSKGERREGEKNGKEKINSIKFHFFVIFNIFYLGTTFSWWFFGNRGRRNERAGLG